MRRGKYIQTPLTVVSASGQPPTARRLRSRRSHAAGGEMDMHIFPFKKLEIVI